MRAKIIADDLAGQIRAVQDRIDAPGIIAGIGLERQGAVARWPGAVVVRIGLPVDAANVRRFDADLVIAPELVGKVKEGCYGLRVDRIHRTAKGADCYGQAREELQVCLYHTFAFPIVDSVIKILSISGWHAIRIKRRLPFPTSTPFRPCKVSATPYKSGTSRCFSLDFRLRGHQ